MTQNTERLTTALADRYRILRHLGAGGMATVYLAEDLKHDRKVAIKVLKPDLAAVLGAERFIVEIKTTAALSHPHILPLFDSGTADGFLFYVMPYIEGETLRDKLNRESQLGVEEAVRITAEVADALDYAHRHGVIHRDIKPENILLHDGRPMVADFGIALAVSAAAGGRMTETGLSLGTPHYMSPEQATAEKELSARSDIYSLASVCYEMLAGEPPHLGGTAQQIIMKIITDRARPVTELRHSVPPHVAAALATALEKLPADRFASAKEFREALLNPSLTTLRAAPYATAVGHGAVAQRRGALIALGALAVAATSVAIAGWLRALPEQPTSRFVQAFPDSLPLASINQNRIAVSPDGRTIAYVAGSTVESRRIWVRSLDQLEGRPLPGTENSGNPSFSPDGKRIAFTSNQAPRALRVISVDGGPSLTLTDSLVDAGGVSWGSDGFIYYDGHLEGDGVARVRESGGEPEVASKPGEGEAYHHQPWALPNGRGFLFTATQSGSVVRHIGVFDARRGTTRVLTEGLRAAYSPSGHLLVVSLDGQLLAAPFDLERLELTEATQVVAERVETFGANRVDISVSSAGDLAYATGGAVGSLRELLWVSRSGVRTPVDPSWSAMIRGRPRLSPDGSRVALTVASGNGSSVWVKQMDNGPATRIDEASADPSWSPDGRTLFVTVATGGGIATVAADGSTPRNPLRPQGLGAQVTPDGEHLLWSFRNDFYTARLRGDTTSRLLINDGPQDITASLSPDGRWLAYASDPSGTLQVYVRPFPNAAASRRQVSSRLAWGPRWSRSGRELFFINTESLYVVPVGADGPSGSAPPRALFSVIGLEAVGAGFDVSPDGQRFLFSAAVGSTAADPEKSRLVYVQNIAAELRTRFAKP